MVMFEEIIFYLSSKHESFMLLQKCSYAFQLWKREREKRGGGLQSSSPRYTA